MPGGIYSNLTCKFEHPVFKPTEHQKETMEEFLKSKYRGILLFHKLGAGKTCTSIIIADRLLREGRIKHVYVMTPGSLRVGWISEYCRQCGASKEYFTNYYTMITYNYSVGDNLPDFNDSLVIIDEVHNLINGVKNFSKHPTLIYNKLLHSNCKILALSGTPVYNFIFEFALLGRLLKPEPEEKSVFSTEIYFPDIIKRVKKDSALDPYSFMKYFNISADGTLQPQNPTVVKNLLRGLVSYYPGAGEEFNPTVIEMPIIKVEMSPVQEAVYWETVEQEQRLAKPPSKRVKEKDINLYEQLKRLHAMATKNVLTRKASNFFYPEIIKEVPDQLVENKGWITGDVLENGELALLYSPKISAFLINLILHINHKHVLFTFSKEKAGAYLVKTLLGMCGVRAEIFSGDLDDGQRQRLLQTFNSLANRYGDIIRVLIVTEAGAEGISVLEARHMHILESSNRMSRTIQAIGRVARFKSHINLPPEERNVKIWKYWSVCSKNPITINIKVYTKEGKQEEVKKTITNKETIDQLLYEKGMKTMRSIQSFSDILKTVSVTKFVEEKNKKEQKESPSILIPYDSRGKDIKQLLEQTIQKLKTYNLMPSPIISNIEELFEEGC